MGSNLDRVSEQEVEQVRILLHKGLSTREIGKAVGRTRNSVIGLISRHIKTENVKNVPTARHRTHTPGSSMFAEPSKPRTFSWETQ